ncbi:MAG TPA: alpha/beta hydrolase [Acidimicrobiales bacterium]|nr:alpha/beta hydrolase [Acidimicrobiales bacterium]
MPELLSKEETDRFVDVGGIRLHYNEAGSGPAFICTHGGGPGANAWDNSKHVLKPLSEHFRTILLDCPGYGESQKGVSRNGVPMDIFIARLIRDFMDVLGIERAHQYGSSQFAPAALRFGLEYPDRCGKIVVQSTQVGPHEGELPEGIKSLGAFANNPTIENMERVFSYFTPREEFRTPEIVKHRFEMALTPGHLESRREMTNASNSDLRGELHRLRTDTLILWGNEDGMIPVEEAFGLLKLIPRSRAVIWGDRSGHFVITEHPDEYARIVIDFLTH